MNQLH
jgi:hypothetical protein